MRIDFAGGMMNTKEMPASQAGEISLGNEISVHRLGYGAMRLTGEGIWGPAKDRKTGLAVFSVARQNEAARNRGTFPMMLPTYPQANCWLASEGSLLPRRRVTPTTGL
jgi:hypothetical protein